MRGLPTPFTKGEPVRVVGVEGFATFDGYTFSGFCSVIMPGEKRPTIVRVENLHAAPKPGRFFSPTAEAFE